MGKQPDNEERRPDVASDRRPETLDGLAADTKSTTSVAEIMTVDEAKAIPITDKCPIGCPGFECSWETCPTRLSSTIDELIADLITSRLTDLLARPT